MDVEERPDPERKTLKKKVTSLACINEDGTHKVEMNVIKKSQPF